MAGGHGRLHDNNFFVLPDFSAGVAWRGGFVVGVNGRRRRLSAGRSLPLPAGKSPPGGNNPFASFRLGQSVDPAARINHQTV